MVCVLSQFWSFLPLLFFHAFMVSSSSSSELLLFIFLVPPQLEPPPLPYGMRRKREPLDLEASGTDRNGKPVSGFTPQLWHQADERCPRGTIPIRRTKEEDLLRVSEMSHFGKKKHRPTRPRHPFSVDLRNSLNENRHQV